MLPPSPPSPPPSYPPGMLYDGGVKLDVLGQSGKMTLSNAPADGSITPNEVTITMDYIREIDAAGNIVGNEGPNSGKHSLQTFASQAFTIDPTRESIEYGVPSTAIDFRTTLVGGSELLIETHVFMHDGVIQPTSNETFNVSGGTVKFSVSVSSWPFCSGETGNSEMGKACKGNTGAYLEFGMEIKGGSKIEETGENSFTLATNPTTGGNVTIEMSNELKLGGEWESMPEGYPMIEYKGSKQLFIFRFPRFNGTALYDPLIDGLQNLASNQENCGFLCKLTNCR